MGESLNLIVQNIDLIADMNTQIASATDKQSRSVGSNQNVSNINNLYVQTTSNTEKTAAYGNNLLNLSSSITQLLKRKSKYLKVTTNGNGNRHVKTH